MIGLEKIIERIEADALRECDGILNDARQRAEILRRDYDVRAAALERMGRAALEEELVRAERSALDGLRLSRRAALLAEKQRLVDEVFQNTLRALETLDEGRKETFWLSLLERAAPEGAGEVILGRGGGKKLGAALCARFPALHLSEETINAPGFVVRCGAVEIDCTLPALLEEQRRHLSAEVAAILFGAEDEHEKE